MESDLTDKQYFLDKINGFETVYGMKSWLFQFLYENNPKTLEGYSGRNAVDYSEWAFLLDHFQLEMGQACNESPPEEVNENGLQEPGQRSGFCFGGGKCDCFSPTIFAKSHRSHFCHERREYLGEH